MSERRDKSIDFDRVARFYDAHVQTDLDLAWWVAQVERRAPGRVLEVMAGSGRISLALLRGCPSVERLVCVDYSAGLLARLRAKLDAEPALARRCTLVEADLRTLALPDTFALVVLGFHAFAELVTPSDAALALARIREHLDPRGEFVTVLHDPHARAASLGPAWVELGTHPLVGEPGRVRVRARWQLVDDEGLVEGVQDYVELDAEGREREHVELPVRFRLWSPQRFEALADAAGLAIVERGYDYRLEGEAPAHPRVRAWALRRR